MSQKLHLNVNATSLRYAHCLLSWYRVIQEGWVEPRFSTSIVYGMAVHKFIEIMYRTEGDLMKAREAGLEVFRQEKIHDSNNEWLGDEHHFIWTCFDVWNNYILKESDYEVVARPDGSPAVEQTFSIPFYEDEAITVNLCGTIDRLGKFKRGCWSIRDWKTTKFWGNPKIYLDAYRMSHQMRFYLMSLRLMARMFPESQLGQIGASSPRACIDGIFLKPKFSELKIIASDVFPFGDEDMDGFETGLRRRITQLSHAIQDGTVKVKEGIMNSTCQLKYNKCSFYPVCIAANPDIEDMLLKKNFVQRPYDPINRDKGV